MGANEEELGLRKRLEALEQERERCEGKKVELFRAVNKLKQELRDCVIDEQRFNEELARLPKSPAQIISDCNEEIKSIEAEADAVRKQLDRLVDKRRKGRIAAAVVVAVVVLLSVSALFLTSKLTGFVTREEVNIYTRQIAENFTNAEQYVLNISSMNVTGELRSLKLSGKLIGNGTVKVYLQKGNTRLLVLDTEALQDRGASGIIAVTGMAIADLSGKAAVLEENITAAVNESEADITPQLPEELNLTLNETQMNRTQANGTTVNETVVNETQPAPEAPLPEAPAAVEKAINISLAYKPGTVFDSNDDGVELDTSAIDFTVEGTNFSWPADSSKLCTRWVAHSVENNTDGVACYGSLECCALVELASSQPNWNDAFELFVGRYGATYNNTVSSQVIFANYSLGPGNVYSEIHYSGFATLPASFIEVPPIEENATENITLANVTVIEFNNICTETCSLAGVAGLNLSEYVLVVEVENATLALDNATYALANVVEADAETPVVEILLPRNMTYTDTIAQGESRNTTPLKLNFTVSEPAAWIGYSINSQDNVTIAANTTVTAANGTNTLILHAKDAAGNVGYAVAGFFVNITAAAMIDTEPPLITTSSPLPNATYNATAVPLSFTTSEPATVSYFLNLQNRTEISANATLAAEEGRNRLLLLATDAAGNAASETVVFFVNTSNTTAAANITVNITPMLKPKKPHFQLDEDAEIEFEYINDSTVNELVKRGKAFRKAAEKTTRKEWITGNETVKAFVLDSEGRPTLLEPQIRETREGKFSITLQKQRQLRAGLYKLVLNFTKDNTTYIQEQNFTWGVLAINTNKSIFLPDEDAFIAMAVLNDKGEMVCDANVSLAITDPAGAATTLTTAAGQIAISPECKVYGVTNMPDYYTTYKVNGVGTYVMNLTAATANGIRTITDNFTVQSQVDFDVARSGPTRIFPPVPYNMSLTITASSNYNGPVVEYVPASFAITQQQGLTVTTVAATNTKLLSWNVQLRKGDAISLAYEFDAPDISPEFYLLGELGIGAWREARQWQIASDAVALTDDSFVIVPTSINIGELVNLTGTYSAAGGGANCWINLTVTEGGTTITTSSATAVKLVDIFFVAPCDRKTLATGRAECDNWAATNDAIPINFTVNGTTGGGGSKTYTTAKQAGCGITIDASDTLSVNVPPDTTPPNNSIIVPLPNINISGSFVINASVNDSASNVLQVNFTLLNSTGNATYPVPMNISSGSYQSGYWNKTFDSTTMGDARYNLSVNATDSAATPNTNISLNVSITIDNTRPNATMIVPLNLTNVSSTVLLINASVNDSLSKVFNTTFRLTTATGSTVTAWLYATMGTGTVDQGTWNTTFDTSTTADGKYNITINATDYANSQQLLNVSTITIDNTKPNATTLLPANQSNLSSTITVRAGANDSTTGTINVTFQFRNSTNQTSRELMSLDTGTIYEGEWAATYNTAQLADGKYNITFNATDFAGNSNLTDKHENFTVTIDNTAPNGTIIAPANNTVINGSFIINASVNDSLSKVFNVTFRLRRPGSDSSAINSTVATGNSDQGYWSSTVNSSNFANGIYNITLNATDFSGNVLLINSSTIRINNSGVLNITLNNVLGINVSQNRTFTVNATISCKGGFCQEVNATLYYNLSSINPDARLNASAGHVPFHNITTFVNQTCGYMDIDAVCSLNWTVNATGTIGRNYSMSINFTSNNSEVLPNGTRSFSVNISSAVITNTAPVVFNDSVALNGSVTLTEGGRTEFTVRFNVTDADGVADLVNAAAGVNITFNGIKRSNNSGNCETQNNGASTRLYTCKVVFNYFDNASSLWEMNITAADVAGAVGYNDSSNYGLAGGGGAAHNMTINSLSAFSIVSSSIAATTSTNTQNVEMTFTINNTGNFDFTLVNLTPTDLNASLTDIFRLEGNFSVNATSSTGIGFGTGILNGTPTNFSESSYPNSATLPHKATPDQAGQTAESDNKANRTLYIYIDIPQNKGLSTGVTYNTSASYPWQVIIGTPS